MAEYDFSNILYMKVTKNHPSDKEKGNIPRKPEEFVFVAEGDELKVYGRFSPEKEFEEINFGNFSWNFSKEGGELATYRVENRYKEDFLKDKGLTELVGKTE
tara:strand:- start:62 stop:367 length:306 start_codon:yes stop_codon:yes gene_type:complete